MKIISTGPPPAKPRTRTGTRRRMLVLGGSGAAAILAMGIVMLSASAVAGGAPEADLPDTGLGAPQAMIADTYGPYDALPADGLEQDVPDAADPDGLSGATGAEPLVVEHSDQAAFRTSEPEVSNASDPGADAQGDTDIEQLAVPANTVQDGDAVEVPEIREPDTSQTADDSAEMDALRREIEALRKELADSKQVPAEPAQGVQAQPEATPEPEQPDDNTFDSEPPSWLVGGDIAQPEDQMPSWLVNTETMARLNNPYDGGPLSQTALSTIPVPGAGFRTYALLDTPVSWLSQADLVNFMTVVIGMSDFDWGDWVTIVGSDGYGLQFFGADANYAHYGLLDEYGRVCELKYIIRLSDTGYVYEAV